MKYQVNGNTEGVRDAMLARLDSLYSYEAEEGAFLPKDLMKFLAECSCALNREIAVYMTRDGEIVNVAVGTDCDVELTDFRLRRNADRLSRVRCVHTHPDGDGRLSDVDLSALKIFRYDAMTAVGVRDGERAAGGQSERHGEQGEKGASGRFGVHWVFPWGWVVLSLAQFKNDSFKHFES